MKLIFAFLISTNAPRKQITVCSHFSCIRIDLLTEPTYIPFVHNDEFYLAGYIRGFLRLPLKYDYIGSVWFKMTYKP